MVNPLFLVLFLLLVLSSFLEIFSGKKINKIIFYSLSIALFVIAGIRYETGADYDSYASIFYSIKQSAKGYFANFDIERGFFVLNYFFKDFEYGFEIVMLIMAYLGVILKAKIFFRYSVFPFISLLLYYQSAYFVGEFAQIRQSVALSFTMLALPYAIERRFVKFFLLTFLAFCFHASAIIFFIAYFIVNLDLRGISKYFFVFLFLTVFILSNVSSFGKYFLENLNVFLFDGYIEQKVSSYLHDKKYGKSIVFAFSEIILLAISLFALFIDFKNYKSANIKYYRAVSNLFLFGTFLYYLLKSNEIFAYRITSYFRIYDCLLIPLLLFTLVKQKKSLSIALLSIFLFFAYSVIFFIYKASDKTMLIYKNIFTDR